MAALARTVSVGLASCRFHVQVSKAAVRALHGAVAQVPSLSTVAAPCLLSWAPTQPAIEIPSTYDDLSNSYNRVGDDLAEYESVIGVPGCGSIAGVGDINRQETVIQAMNRNARDGTKVGAAQFGTGEVKECPLFGANKQQPNRYLLSPLQANHGKRPCSNRRRKRAARKRLSDHPFLPLKSKQKKGYDF